MSDFGDDEVTFIKKIFMLFAHFVNTYSIFIF